MTEIDPCHNQEEDEQGAKFLERDFNQCFQQMRHYDGQIMEIVKFALTAYSVIAGAALAFYKYGLDKQSDYRAPAIAITIVGFLLGTTLLALLTRLRVYSVLVLRYINEHRELFLKKTPLGFQNRTRMYVNPTQPPYFNWRSSQALLLSSIALLNSALLGLGLYFIIDKFSSKWCFVSLSAGAVFTLQLLFAVLYLQSREGKSGSAAVFGRD